MIEIKYYQDKNEISIKGHANSDEIGHDLVCASVSALFYTLVENAKHYEELKYGKIAKISIKSGNVRFKFNALESRKKTVIFGFNTLCVGFELLAENFPQNILYKIL